MTHIIVIFALLCLEPRLQYPQGVPVMKIWGREASILLRFLRLFCVTCTVFPRADDSIPNTDGMFVRHILVMPCPFV